MRSRARLDEALKAPGTGRAALEGARALLGRVEVFPAKERIDGPNVELVGDLAAMLHLVSGSADGEPDLFVGSVQLVAGPATIDSLARLRLIVNEAKRFGTRNRRRHYLIGGVWP